MWPGGRELFYRVFKPTNPRAVVILVHGHGNHSGGLQNISERLLEHDYLAYAFDLRGHGKSPGVRGHIRKWEEYRFIELVGHSNKKASLTPVVSARKRITSMREFVFSSS